jgi:hypothetical protein
MVWPPNLQVATTGTFVRVQASSAVSDLRAGAVVEEWRHASLQRAPDRFRGIRQMAAWDASPKVNTAQDSSAWRACYSSPEFRQGFASSRPRFVVRRLGVSPPVGSSP